MRLFAFLKDRLFDKIGVGEVDWLDCPGGHTWGDSALLARPIDLLRVALFCMNKGEGILNEEYVTAATSKQVENGTCIPTLGCGRYDAFGYGYQFWLNGRDGFRGDGAYGQFCYVFPKSDMVVALTGESGNTVQEVDFLYELLDNMFSDNTEGYEELKALTKTVYKPIPVKEGFNNDLSFAVAENPSDVRKIRFFGEMLLHVEFETDYGKKEIVCGNGEYISNHVLLKNLCVGLDARDERKDTIERVNLFAAYESDGENKIKLTLRHMDKPHNQHWYVDLAKGTIQIKIMVGTIQTTEFKLSPIENTEN